MTTKDELWAQVQSEFYQNVSQMAFDTFIKPLKPITLTDDVLVLEAPDDVIINHWANNQYNMDFVKYAVAKTGSFVQPELKKTADLVVVPAEVVNAPGFIRESDLNEHFTFDSFVVGEGNQQATAVARAVAEAPGRQWNPYLIYGGVGLGKTHLMQSIGNELAKLQPNARIKYVTTEDFTNAFTDSLRAGEGATSNFKREYRNVDLLLVDDIQFLSGKGKIQEEFFNTFNAITKSGHQIVMTSDKLPKTIPDLESRLVSRFEQGIAMDIQRPDLPTRVAILQNKAESSGLEIPTDMLTWIAEQIDDNVRVLEGAFLKVEAALRFQNQPPTIETAQKALGDLKIVVDREITVERIQQVVGDFYMLTVDDLKSKNRKKELVNARHIAMYLTRTLTDMSLPNIGKSFGGRDHASVLHATTKITDKLESDNRLKETIDALTDDIKKGE
ncbi:MAG TPA: chromosomal replication initiator protein DnaA [Lactobacillaceae bacterium]